LSELEIKRRRSQGIINGSLSSYYDFIGVNTSNLNSSFGGALNESWNQLQNRPGNFGIRVNVSIPIIDWGENKARVKAARATLQQNIYEMEEAKVAVEREVLNLTTKLKSSLKRLELLEKSVVVAEKSFAISTSRFTNGDIDNQALALDRVRLNNAYVIHLESYIDYKLMLSDLKRKTYYDFENNREIL
jgi:outer membrane protein TolC